MARTRVAFAVTSTTTINAKANSLRIIRSKQATQDANQQITGGVFHMVQANATPNDLGCDMHWNPGRGLK
jgi:hypothetical protein